MLTALAVLGPMINAERKVIRSECDTTNSNDNATIFNFSEKALLGDSVINLSDYRGKVVLVVNVATYWGLTFQYNELNALHKDFDDLEVLAFPCNQFGLQEPGGTPEEILNGIRYVRPGNNFVPDLTLFRKIEVNGRSEHGLFTYLKEKCPATRDYYEDAKRLHYHPIRHSDIRWNFEKFLINREGRPVYRYDVSTRAKDIQPDIEHLLSKDYNPTSRVSRDFGRH